MKILKNNHIKESPFVFYNKETEKVVRQFHESLPMYKKTRLVHLKDLAKELNVQEIFIKDEGDRFGLTAFKALGGIYAVARILAENLEWNFKEITFEDYQKPEVREQLGKNTFITATDGNHGRGLAWASEVFGQNCVVYMPGNSKKARVEAIRSHGAKCYVLEGENYDACVEKAMMEAEKNNWYFVQDTSQEDYEKIPHWIIESYFTMAAEALEDLKELDLEPTHVFIQAGVGSMPAAITEFFVNYLPNVNVVVVEADTVDPIYRSVEADDAIEITGNYHTLMAGLCCGIPASIAYPVLKDHAKYFMTIEDEYAATAMRILSSPLGEDPRVIAGESGAAGFGAFISAVYIHPEKREELNLDKDSVCLFFNTEEATDPESYRKIVWEGSHPTEKE